MIETIISSICILISLVYLLIKKRKKDIKFSLIITILTIRLINVLMFRCFIMGENANNYYTMVQTREGFDFIQYVLILGLLMNILFSINSPKKN